MTHQDRNLFDDGDEGAAAPTMPTRVSDLEGWSQQAESRVSDLQMQLAKESRASKAEVSEMKSRLTEIEMLLGVSPTRWKEMNWRRIGSNQVVLNTDLPNDYASKLVVLPKDIYSIVATCDWKSFPFWFALLIIFAFQFSLLVLLLMNQIGIEEGNFLGSPANVETTVRAAQILALVIALFSQDDLREGIEGLGAGIPTIYQGDPAFQAMGSVRWYFAYTIRFLQGFVNLFASFVLLFQAESVLDLMLNFLGVQFISGLDDLAFILGQQGYFGSSVQGSINDILQAKFLRDSAKNKALCRGYSNVLGIFAVLAVMVGIYSNLAIQQDEGTFAIEYVTAEFGDEVIPFLGLFNGYYGVKKEGPTLSRRLVYEQLDSEGVGGKFGYCNNLEDDGASEGWVFFDGNSISIESACKHYILRSGATNTFDLLDATSNQWYTKGGQLVDYLQVSELANDSLVFGARGTFLDTIDSCDQLDIPVRFESILQGTKSQLFEKLPVTETEADLSLDATRSHPIYLGGSSSEIILFTGRRWVLTTAENISEDPSISSSFRDGPVWNHDAIVDYFYHKDNGFRAIEQVKESNQWILAMSDIVDATTDSGTPLGLQWFNVRYESGSANRGFPFADLTQPQEATLGCARCGDGLVDCANEGQCVDGVCECRNRASGVLCRDAPLGDGVCDEFFNTAEFNYDGGDCCASTCTGTLCGANGLSVAFGVDLRDNTFENQYLEDATVLGFEHCKDPNMETFTIELVPLEEAYPESWGNCGLESVTVICDGVVYLRTPNLYMTESVDEVEMCHEDGPLLQPIHVPAGVSCELSRPLDDFERFFEILLFRGSSTRDTPSILQGSNATTSLTWSVPSGCLQQVFTEYLGDVNRIYDMESSQGRAVQTMAADGTSALLCSFDQDLVMERYALAVFNVSVGLESTKWQEHQCYGWGSAVDGIQIDCDDNDRVVSIQGSQWNFINMRGGTIPSELFMLSKLSYLDLSDNSVSGTLPTEIGLHQSLTHLFLNYTNVEGSLPREFFRLSTLKHLDLSSLYDSVGGTVPTEIGLLSNLSYLNLGGSNFIGTLPTDIGKLSSLSFLFLRGAKLTGNIPSEIGLLTELVELNLASSSFEGPIPSEIGQLQRVTSLDLDRVLHGSLPSEIGRLSLLETLQLGDLGGSVLPSEISLLTHLTSVNWDSLVMSGGTIPTEIGYFSKMPKLDYLGLTYRNLVGTLPNELLLLSQLTSITLFGNDLTGTFPTGICQLSNLVFLSISDSSFTGQLPTELGCLTKLKYLVMGGNDFSGTLVSEISALSSLESLQFQRNRLEGSIPDSFGDLTKLSGLELDGNDLTGSFPILPPSIQYCRVDDNCFQDLQNALASDCNVSGNCA